MLPLAAMQETGLLVLVFLVAFLEAWPAWGRWVPGHYGVAFLVALGQASYGALPAFLLASFLGAFLSDVGIYLWMRRAQVRNPRGHGAWWRLGLDLEDAARALRERGFGAFFARKFSTRERARLACAAVVARWSLPRLAGAAALACLVWSAAWVAVGAGAGLLAAQLPPGAALVAAFVAFVLITAPGLSRRAPQV